MPSLLPHPLSDEDVASAVKDISVDLVFLLDNMKVHSDIQAKLAGLGYTDLVVFAQLEDEPAKVRTVIKEDLGIDPTASPQHRNMCARLEVAWEAVRKRMTAKLWRICPSPDPSSRRSCRRETTSSLSAPSLLRTTS